MSLNRDDRDHRDLFLRNKGYRARRKKMLSETEKMRHTIQVTSQVCNRKYPGREQVVKLKTPSPVSKDGVLVEKEKLLGLKENHIDYVKNAPKKVYITAVPKHENSHAF